MTHSNNDDLINGIDPKRTQAIVDLIRNDTTSDSAKPEFRTTVAWDSGYHATMRVTDGQVVLADEPQRFGGEGMGITPEDLLLTAVGACLVATYIGGLSAASINVEHLRLSVSGRVNFRAAFAIEPGSPGFEDIKVVVDLQTDAPEQEVIELLEKLNKAAPIPDTIMRPVPVNVEIIHHSEVKATSP